jgi:hypothetical protein
MKILAGINILNNRFYNQFGKGCVRAVGLNETLEMRFYNAEN